MEASELRIGNWVLGAYDTPIQVGTTQIVNLYHNMESIQPIPLTEEWLLKFGFEKETLENNYWYSMSFGGDMPDLITNDIGDDAYSNKLEFVFLSEFDRVKCKYVHQLQNLYFALTGEELTIKENETA